MVDEVKGFSAMKKMCDVMRVSLSVNRELNERVVPRRVGDVWSESLGFEKRNDTRSVIWRGFCTGSDKDRYSKE